MLGKIFGEAVALLTRHGSSLAVECVEGLHFANFDTVLM
jgi:hypothetical protein